MTAEERAEMLVNRIPLDADAHNPEVLREVYSAAAAAIRAAEEAATLKERERCKLCVMAVASWVTDAVETVRKQFVERIESGKTIQELGYDDVFTPAAAAPAPAPSQTPASSVTASSPPAPQ